MLEWTIPFLVKAASGATAWKWLKVKGGGNVHAVAVEYKAAHPEVVGYDTSQAWERWL